MFVIPGTHDPNSVIGAQGDPLEPFYRTRPDVPSALPPGPYTLIAVVPGSARPCAQESVVLDAGDDLGVTLRPIAGGCK